MRGSLKQPDRKQQPALGASSTSRMKESCPARLRQGCDADRETVMTGKTDGSREAIFVCQVDHQKRKMA
jgi:hypothetical protein